VDNVSKEVLFVPAINVPAINVPVINVPVINVPAINASASRRPLDNRARNDGKVKSVVTFSLYVVSLITDKELAQWCRLVSPRQLACSFLADPADIFPKNE
jgi:hypothetical protein